MSMLAWLGCVSFAIWYSLIGLATVMFCEEGRTQATGKPLTILTAIFLAVYWPLVMAVGGFAVVLEATRRLRRGTA